MNDYQLTKQAFKSLKKLSKSDRATAIRIKKAIIGLTTNEVTGESLQGFNQFKKIRIGKYRLIYTHREDSLLITIIEKRETVYQTFEHLFKHSDLF